MEECTQLLRALDERTLHRRAEKLSIIVQIETPVGYYMPNRTSHLLSEADACFVDGHYAGCVLALASGVEHGLRELLQKPMGMSLVRLIGHGITDGLISKSQAEVLRVMKDYRNSVTHSDIDYLATGEKLQIQGAPPAPQSIMEESEWEKFEPTSEDHKEITADLAAEHRVRELLVQVREVIHDIFDGQPPRSRTRITTLTEDGG